MFVFLICQNIFTQNQAVEHSCCSDGMLNSV
jgi:hypothetical protein